MSPSVWDDLEIAAYDILSRSVVPSIQKMKERFQATITHLRENVSNAIESDLRDFGASSHLPYQGLRPLREEESKLPGASTNRADSLRTEQFLPEGNLARWFTRHCVNSAFTGFLRGAVPFRERPIKPPTAHVTSRGRWEQ
ncbi:hypothetical protein KIP88_32380 [Bradyrhizobium sp. SRL28]|uniref:hypothetical protein n=1 Tax=Bradyrhizobium sp. SRL28 TaxID=2836178 RepID=UPI001BDE2A36|nr:hypothetical protein [Bradyrhizobium sp. SRL28]MBT1515191.1 hypothetical protein [Bradyrhizobium sp. SRL28]